MSKTKIIVRDPDVNSQDKYEVYVTVTENVEYVPYSIPPSIQRSYVIESELAYKTENDQTTVITSGQPRKSVDEAVAVFSRNFITYIAKYLKA